MKILLTEGYPEINKELLSYISNDHTLLDLENDFAAEEIDALMIRSKTIANKNLLDSYQNLKYIFRVGVGLDKVDMQECKNRGIEVINTPQANADSVADLVVGSIIVALRSINKPFTRLEDRFTYKGHELGTQSVAIVGFGNIGKKIYHRLQSFGVKDFSIYDPYISKDEIESYKYCKKIDNKSDIYSHARIISFHIPLLDSTRNFMGKNEIQNLQNDAIIINTSRGGIIYEVELIKFLQKNNDAYFYADVWEEEPLEPKKELLELQNVTITPHIGAMTIEAEKNMHYFEKLKRPE